MEKENECEPSDVYVSRETLSPREQELLVFWGSLPL